MLLAATAILRADQPGKGWPARPQNLVNGWLYRQLLRDTAPALATHVHDALGDKPLTLAALPADRPGELGIRVTTLDDDLGLAVLSGLLRVAEDQRPITLDHATGRLTAVVTEAGEHPLAGRTTWDELLATRPARSWRFRFHTPTAFRMGDVDQPLPVPRSLWGSWLRRWNAWAPAHLALDEDWLNHFDCGVALTGLLLRTGTVTIKGGRLSTGFVGQVTVEAVHPLPDAMLQTLTILARFSAWSGTGRQTLYGMGVTQWL